jgi:hypothetical protein
MGDNGLIQALGKLVRVDAREIWQHEAHHFTPWLRDNIDRLSEALGIEIEVEAIEVGVGDFSADLHGKDVTSDRPVVIENQLTPTDHAHLGQVLTYSAGLDAAIIVWIAPEFREEHRQAVDWLNRHTDESLDFFGVELELLRIDDSVPAPHFKLVAQPNEWAKAARKRGPDSLPSERDLRYQAFFEGILIETKKRKPDLTSASRVSPQSWVSFGAGRAGFSIGWGFSRKGFQVELYIDAGEAAENKGFFDALQARRAEIEAALGFQLQWERLDARRASRIVARRDGATINDDPQALAELQAWGITAMIKFANVVRPIIKDLVPIQPA